MSDMPYLVRARYLVPLDERNRAARIEDGYVLTLRGSIAEVGAYDAAVGERLSARFGEALVVLGRKPGMTDVPLLEGILLPGFIKAHGHDHESPIIGIAKDEPLTSWLDHAVNAFTSFMSSERETLTKAFGKPPQLVAYLKARLDDTMFGITSSMVHHCNHNKYTVAEIVESNRLAGTNMTIAVGSQDRHYYEAILDRPEQAVARLDGYYARFKDVPRCRLVPGPDQFFSNGPDMLRALKRWAVEHDTFVHIHSSEEPNTTKWFRDTYGMTPVEYGVEIGFIDDRAILAHQVNCTDRDLELLRDHGAKVVHNPLANTILGSGMPPVLRMLEMGIPVAISTDGSGSADNQNILAAARLASQYQKALHQDASVLPAQQVLEMITVVPAGMLGLNAGCLSPGRDADLVLIDTATPNLTPTRLDNCVENLVWASTGAETRYVMANGELLVDDYQYVKLNRDEILDQVQELSERMAAHIRRAPEIRGTGAHR
ncbi:amidohydrolase family protein [bacterium]|nr:amidohydrolase family protein [candidate division CSSED10-310 bacterium]